MSSNLNGEKGLRLMNKRDFLRFAKLIEQEKQNVREKLGITKDQIESLQASSPGNQSYSNHMADSGSDAMEQEQAFMHASQGTNYLLALEQALKRIEKGTYGTCEECTNKIPPKRLEAYLAARLCVECKSKLEKHRRS